MVNIGQFISIAVHKEIILSVITLPLRFVYRELYFVSHFVSLPLIYLFNHFSCANKKEWSIQSTLHTSAKPQIFHMSPVSFVGLKTASM